MTISLGIKQVLDYSVLSALCGALFLAAEDRYPLSLPARTKTTNSRRPSSLPPPLSIAYGVDLAIRFVRMDNSTLLIAIISVVISLVAVGFAYWQGVLTRRSLGAETLLHLDDTCQSDRMLKTRSAAATTVRRACDRSTVRITTALLCSIRTATTSRRSASPTGNSVASRKGDLEQHTSERPPVASRHRNSRLTTEIVPN